jgi:hypothetical protein
LLVYSFVFFFFGGGWGGVKFVLHRLSMGVSQNFLDVKGYET